MKKFATVILSILTSALLLFGLAACGGNGNNGDGKTHYTVTFTGEGVETFTQSVEDGELVLEPKDPTRGEDYDFDGWFRDGAAEAYDFSTPVHEDFTLTALDAVHGRDVPRHLHGGRGGGIHLNRPRRRAACRAG